MFAVVLCSLLASSTLSAEIPKPRLTHLASGDVEISVEGRLLFSCFKSLLKLDNLYTPPDKFKAEAKEQHKRRRQNMFIILMQRVDVYTIVIIFFFIVLYIQGHLYQQEVQ